jgi:hypothetical protein
LKENDFLPFIQKPFLQNKTKNKLAQTDFGGFFITNLTAVLSYSSEVGLKFKIKITLLKKRKKAFSSKQTFSFLNFFGGTSFDQTTYLDSS